MSLSPDPPYPPARPPAWKIALALGVVYLVWGTTYLAIKEGVRTLPPALFGGVRVTIAGVVVLAVLRLTGQSVRMGRRDLAWTALVGALFFVGGNGLITLAEKWVPSGLASVLVATTPLWLALLEAAWPWGERLTGLGWAGVLAGLGGVVVLGVDKLAEPDGLGGDLTALLVLGSAFAWSVGSFVQRHRPTRGSPLVAAGYQMLIGGTGLTLIGLAGGEVGQLTPEAFTFGAVFSFFWLLLVGSLVGFVTYTWLLRHVTTAVAGTYAYVNPVVALVVGWGIADETITPAMVGGMLVILAGVALVRVGHDKPPVSRDRTTYWHRASDDLPRTRVGVQDNS